MVVLGHFPLLSLANKVFIYGMHELQLLVDSSAHLIVLGVQQVRVASNFVGVVLLLLIGDFQRSDLVLLPVALSIRNKK